MASSEIYDTVDERVEERESFFSKLTFNFPERVAIWLGVVAVIGIFVFVTYKVEDKWIYGMIGIFLFILILASLKDRKKDFFIPEYEARCIVIAEYIKRKNNLTDRRGFKLPEGKFYVDIISKVDHDPYTWERIYRVFQCWFVGDGGLLEPYKAFVYKNGEFEGWLPGAVVEGEKIRYIIPEIYRVSKSFEKGGR